MRDLIELAKSEGNVAVFTRGGSMTHLLDASASPNSQIAALCGRSPGFGTYWHGTGSQAEYDDAATRVLCTPCYLRFVLG